MVPMRNILQLSPRAFAHLGLQEVAYVKRVAGTDEPAFAVHAADGTRLAVLRDRDTALRAIREHDLQAVPLH